MRKRSVRSAAGQALILVALAMPLFFSVVGLVIDGSNLMVHRRSLQNAADAAALAAAQELPAGGPCLGPDSTPGTCLYRVLTTANQYSHDVNHGPTVDHACAGVSDRNCYTTPYKGNPQLVEVRLREQVHGFVTGLIDALFRSSLGNVFRVGARSVSGATAQVAPPTTSTNVTSGDGSTITGTSTGYGTSTGTTTTGGVGAVAFAKSTNCTKDPGGAAITYSGAGGGSIGALAANGGISVSGNTNTKSIDYLALGRLGQMVGGVPCYDNPGVATINNPPVQGPWSPPKDWPLAPPAIPTPGSGCNPVSSALPVTTKALTNNVATITTAANHGLVVGDDVLVAVNDNRFDGWYTITAKTNRTFSYAKTGANVAPSAATGTATPTSQSVTLTAGWETSHSPGIYCITGTTATLTLQAIDLTGRAGGLACQAGATCGYTFFAPLMSISGGNYRCFQYCNPAPTSPPSSGPLPTLFYATAGDIKVQGSAPNLVGYIFAPSPAGEVSFTGGGVSGGSGFIEAQTIKLAGNFATYLGTGPLVGGQTTTTIATFPVTTITTTSTIPGFTSTSVTTIPGATTGTTVGLDE
jgi:Putative Flp pilus-assembly TadE/G-like